MPNGGNERRARDFLVDEGVCGELLPEDGKGTGVLIKGRLGTGGKDKSISLASSRELPPAKSLTSSPPTPRSAACCCREDTSDIVEGVAIESVEVVRAGRLLLLSLDMAGEWSNAETYDAVSSRPEPDVLELE